MQKTQSSDVAFNSQLVKQSAVGALGVGASGTGVGASDTGDQHFSLQSGKQEVPAVFLSKQGAQGPGPGSMPIHALHGAHAPPSSHAVQFVPLGVGASVTGVGA